MANTNYGGVANTLADVTLALTDMLDEVYAQESKTAMWRPNPALVRGFQNSKTGQIPTIETQSLGDYSMVNGYPSASVQTTFQNYTLQYDRGASLLIDVVDLMQDGNVAQASAVLGEFSRSHLVPEIDAVRIGKVTTAALGTTDHFKSSYTPSKSTIFSEIMDGLHAIQDDTGIDEGMTIMVNSKYLGMLKQSTEFSRSITVNDSVDRINSKIGSIDGNDVVAVPSARMFSAFDVSATPGVTGFSASSGAVGVVALISAPNTAQGIVAHNITNIINASENQTADATRINFRCYHDCIVPKNKKQGLYALTL